PALPAFALPAAAARSVVARACAEPSALPRSGGSPLALHSLPLAVAPRPGEAPHEGPAGAAYWAAKSDKSAQGSRGSGTASATDPPTGCPARCDVWMAGSVPTRSPRRSVPLSPACERRHSTVETAVPFEKQSEHAP